MTHVAEDYLSTREVCREYAKQLMRTARSLQECGLRTPSQLNPSVFAAWLKDLQGSSTTRKNYRRMAITLWKHAAKLGYVGQPSDELMRVKGSEKPPVAWSQKELEILLDHCGRERGTFKSGCPRSLFFRSFVLAGYELGIRRSDLHNMEAHQLRDNRVWVIQNKTNVPIGKVVTEDCAESMQQMIRSGDGKTVWRWALSQRPLSVHFRRLVDSAGLSGSIKFLRRSGATACELAQPGSATKFLGHLSPELAQKYYLDQTLLADSVPRPPAISSRG